MAPSHDVLYQMADRLHAFLAPESEARASDEPWEDQRHPIQPHVLGAARQELLDARVLAADHTVTRGGRRITTFRLRDRSGRQRATEDAAARERLLYARYLGWATGTATDRSLIGPSAERMLHQTLRDVSPELGYQLENPIGGQTSRVLGHEVPAGALDNAAHLYLGGVPQRYSVLFEVKSRREWIYHTSEELYQVLYKGAVLQRQLPQARIVPVLVCRRAHITAFRMMKDLGGYIIDVRQQWLPPGHARATNEDILEVRNELYFQDLNFAPANWIHPFLRRQLAVHLPRNIA